MAAMLAAMLAEMVATMAVREAKVAVWEAEKVGVSSPETVPDTTLVWDVGIQSNHVLHQNSSSL